MWRSCARAACAFAVAALPLTAKTAAAGETPVPRKLESLQEDRSGMVPTADGDAPAQQLPAVMTVCIGRAARRCWTEAGAAACTGGEVFGGGSTGAGDAGLPALLAQCWREAGGDHPATLFP